MRISTFGKSVKGKKCKLEDHYCILKKKDVLLCILADGVGGLCDSGEVSKEVIQYLQLWFDNLNYCEISYMKKQFVLQLKKLNEQFLRKSGATTFTAILMKGKEACMIHIGDCRLYRYNKKLELLSEDDTLSYRKYLEGQIKKNEIHTHETARYLLQALGSHVHFHLQVKTFDIHPNQRFMLCSDGLYGCLNEEDIESALCCMTDTELENTCDHLIQKALQNKAKDDLSVILLYVK